MNSSSSKNIPLSDEEQGILHALDKKIASGLDGTSLEKVVTQVVNQLLKVERYALFLWDKEVCELWSAFGLPNENIQLDARVGIAGASTMKGEIINVLDAQKDPRFHKGVDLTTNRSTEGVLSIPLKKKSGEILGTIQFLSPKGERFSQKDELLGNAIADRLGQTIDSPNLLKQLQQRYQKIDGSKHVRLIGTSERMQQLIRRIDLIRESELDVLITGENGTGKELVAAAIHKNSPRANEPFVRVNCGAFSESLLDSELFGHVKGAFTNANRDKKGVFEQANRGTLFLDEIGDTSPSLQIKLLRALQEREIRRVGDEETIEVDVRIIAATNKNLEELISQNKFRQDLHFRLKVIQITTPSLREIPEDIPLLANFFLRRCLGNDAKSKKHFTKKTMQLLRNHHWPGNVRELEHEVQRLSVMVRSDSISPEDLDHSILSPHEDSVLPIEQQEPIRIQHTQERNQSLKQLLDQYEKQLIEQALQVNHYHQGNTAKSLGLTRLGLHRKMTRLDIKR